jgi:hypothetical protein
MLLKYRSGLMKVIILTAFFLLTGIYAQGQNLIGFKHQEIRKYMKENQREMNYNNVVNSKFSYLKYSDNLERQTVLFFLNRDSVCKNVRIICDSSLKLQKVKELNSLYAKKGENKWIDKRNGKEYIIELSDGKWSSVISIEQKK